MSRFALIVTMLFFSHSIAFGQNIITRCGSSEGHDYWVNNEALNVGGWKKANIPGGKIVLLRNGDDFDIEITDARGIPSTVSSQNGVIVPVENSNNNVTLIINYPGSGTEVYSFTLDEKKKGELIWSKIRHHSLIRNGGIYKSACYG